MIKFMNFISNPMLIPLSFLGAAIILMAVWVFILERRIKKLMSGKSGASLESTISTHATSLENLFQFRKAVENELGRLDGRIRKKLNGAKTVRFNPFQGTGTGGNQSFATAFLDEDGNGVVLSSLYSREKVSIFAKPITKGKSEFELTDEEAEVVKK